MDDKNEGMFNERILFNIFKISYPDCVETKAIEIISKEPGENCCDGLAKSMCTLNVGYACWLVCHGLKKKMVGCDRVQ